MVLVHRWREDEVCISVQSRVYLLEYRWYLYLMLKETVQTNYRKKIFSLTSSFM